MDLVVLWSADADVQAAYEFQEDIFGNGQKFLDRLDEAFGHLRQFPEMAPFFTRRYRRMLVPRFPYGIFYTVEARGIVVAAVMDLRQDPRVIMRRLKG